MKTKILIIVLLMSFSVALMSQTTENGLRKELRGPNREMRVTKVERSGSFQGLNLTDAQKTAFKESMMAIQKQLQPLKNELGEAQAHQKTLMTAEKPDLTAINKNIDKIGTLRIEMAKIKMKHHLEMRAQLTDEQKLKFDFFAGKMVEEGGRVGMMGRMGMQHRMGNNFLHSDM